MDGGEDLLMRPIKAGYLRFADLDDPQRDLADFIFCNEAMDVEIENQRRHQKWSSERKK